MKTRVVYSRFKKTYNGRNYQILVYGELSEAKGVDGFYVVPVTFNGKCNKIKDFDLSGRQFIKGYNKFYSPTKSFNMGWSICAEPDVFVFDEGVKICKRRFAKSPMTTQNGRFLTVDMCQAIVDNEAAHIANNIDLYLPKEDKNNNKYDVCFKFDKFGIKDDEFVVELDGNPIKDFIHNDALTNNETDEHECLCKGGECKCKNERGVEYYEPNKGDYVAWHYNGRRYLGIFNWSSESEGIIEEQRNKFFFFAPINEDNGLISHDESLLFGDFDVPLNNPVRFMRTTCCDNRLIDDYLKGALRWKWDKDRFHFVICVDYGM